MNPENKPFEQMQGDITVLKETVTVLKETVTELKEGQKTLIKAVKFLIDKTAKLDLKTSTIDAKLDKLADETGANFEDVKVELKKINKVTAYDDMLSNLPV